MLIFFASQANVKSFTRTTFLLTQAQAEGLKRAAENDPVGLRVSQLIRDRRQQGNGHVAFQNSEPRAAGPAAGSSNGIYSVRAGRLAAAESHPHAHREIPQRQRHRTSPHPCPPTRGAGDDSERASQRSQRQREPRLVPAAERARRVATSESDAAGSPIAARIRSDQAPTGGNFPLVAGNTPFTPSLKGILRPQCRQHTHSVTDDSGATGTWRFKTASHVLLGQRQRHRTSPHPCPPTRGAGDDSERASQRSQRQREPRLVPAAERARRVATSESDAAGSPIAARIRSDQAPTGGNFPLVARQLAKVLHSEVYF